MKLPGNIRKPFQLAGNILLLFVALTAGWMLLSARNSSGNFEQIMPLISQIQNICNKQNRCPTAEEFDALSKHAGIKLDQMRYSLGEYAVPGKGKAFELLHMGEQYFRIYYLPATDIGYHASGGKDVELVMWKSLDGINTPLR